MNFITFIYTSCAYIYATIAFCNISFMNKRQLLLEKRIEKLERRFIMLN